MSRVITFSTKFPKGHPKEGQPTYFVEKVLNSFDEYWDVWPFDKMPSLHKSIEVDARIEDKKHHTIRAGNRWKVGDKFSPRVWSGKPYNSPQITIAPDMEIKQVWDFEIDNGTIVINGEYEFWGNGKSNHELLTEIAKNDGLNPEDLLDWFRYPKPFQGQIICWNETVKY